MISDGLLAAGLSDDDSTVSIPDGVQDFRVQNSASYTLPTSALASARSTNSLAVLLDHEIHLIGEEIETPGLSIAIVHEIMTYDEVVAPWALCDALCLPLPAGSSLDAPSDLYDTHCL